MNNTYYEQRFIKSSKNNTNFQLFDEENNYTLYDLFKENKRIILLGNPGIGKSTELKMLFEILWEKREKNLNFPFNINIKNFRPISKFDDLIPFKEWKELPSTTFILDGLDEISNIQDFISELDSFLKTNNDRNISIVLSCRTNIYEKYIVKIPEFKYFYLEGLLDNQINNILQKQIHKALTYNELNKFRIYLENPFNLNLFCKFYESTNCYPQTYAESWNLFIENELQKLSKEKFIKRQEIDVSHVKNCLEKVAFTNELMQQNYILEDDLYELLGKDDKYIFEQISLIDKLPGTDKFVFRHKNYQEFFSAKYLSKLCTIKIIELIKIKNINKTKPSLFNTITFLLNILDDEKFDFIKDWLMDNEPEILFLTEKDKMNNDIKHTLFTNYFNEISIERTFWFGRDRRFSIDKIAEFAEIDFLIETIKRNDHFRSVISAFDVLAYTETSEKDVIIQKLLVEIILANNNYVDEALRTFKLKGFHKIDNNQFIKIAKYFENSSSFEIHHQIISMLADFQEIDDYFDILENSVHKLYKILPDRVKDNTIRGTQWSLGQIFLKIKISENFLKVLNILFNRNFDLKLSDFYSKELREKLIKKTVNFINLEENFLYRIIDAFLKPTDNFIYRNDNILTELINKSKKELNAFRYIINVYGITDRNYLLISYFENIKCIDYLAEKYKANTLKVSHLNDISHLRNRYFQNSHNLGYYFEESLKSVGYNFPNSLPTVDDITSARQSQLLFEQNNLDILFNKQDLVREVTKIFEENDTVLMSWKKIHEIQWNSNLEENHNISTNSVFRVISDSVKNGYDKSLNDIKNNIYDDGFMLIQIKNKLKNQKEEKYIVNKTQINYIIEKCLQFSIEFDATNVLIFNSDSSFSLRKNYNMLKMLYFFDQKFNISYSKDFYLKTLKYCNVLNNSGEIIDFIKCRVNDDYLFNLKIINNINNESLVNGSLADHIDYSIENKLEDTYLKVEEIILKAEYKYSQKDYLLKFYNVLSEKSKVFFLKKCCTDINSSICWNAIDIFIEKEIESDFILDIANKYFITLQSDFISEALNVLFYCNDSNSLIRYTEVLGKYSEMDNYQSRNDISLKNLSNYKKLINLEYIETIFHIIYDESIKDDFKFHLSKSNFATLIINLSKTEEGYKKIQDKLNNIKYNISDKHSKFFYVNHLIENSELSYYNSISETLTFSNVKSILKSIESEC